MGLTLTEVAKQLGHSIVYLRDVENGSRHPFADQALEKIADILGLDAVFLEILRAIDNGVVEIPINSKARNVALALLERKNNLSAEDSDRIVEILKKN